MKKILLPVFLASSVVLTASGCSAPEPQPQPQAIEQVSEVEEYVGVCIDPATQNRVDDDYCEEGDDDYNPYFMPYFYPYGYLIPGLGLPVHGGHSSVHGTYRMGFDKKGGSSKNFKSTSPQYLPKGYSLPANAKVKQSVPKAPQPAAPVGLSKTPAKHPVNVPKAPVVVPKPAAPVQAPVQQAPVQKAPVNNYKAPQSGLKKSNTTSRSSGTTRRK